MAIGQAGKKEEAVKLKQWATLLPLAGSSARRLLAEGLDFRGQKTAGIRQWELLQRVASLHHWNEFNQAKASELLGRAKQVANPAAAAAHLQHFWLFVLQPNVSLTNSADFVRIESTIHGLRAISLLNAARFDEAIVEIDQAHAAYSGDIALDEIAVPKLMAAGRTEAAEKIFSGSRESMETVLSEFPSSALYHNNLAWLFARCDRQLDDALVHATKATSLAPSMAGYVDTLAEVHFRQGDKQAAVDLELKALEKDPNSLELRQQLARFEEE
jgi:tetratricopeptide (TPR) repeat protein